MEWAMTWTTISVVGGITAAVFFILRRDIGNLREDVSKDMKILRNDVGKDIETLRVDVHKDIGNLREDVHKDMNILRTDIGNLREDVRENSKSIKRLIETTSSMSGYLTRSFGTDFTKSQKTPQQAHVGVSEESKKYNKQ